VTETLQKPIPYQQKSTMMENKNLHDAPVVVALDIGTTKVCAIAGRRDANGKIEILAIGKVESEGVSRGVVSNIEKTASNNIHRCVERVGLKVGDMTLEPIASSEAILSYEEKEAGVALVDIGGGTTDITIFHEGIVRHTAVIPFGGNVVTRDIKEGCMVLQDQAEKLKRNFGSAMSEEVYDNRIITIPGLKGREPKEISEKNLALIIQARVEEILDYVVWEIRKSGFERNLIGGIVLTGGGALLNHLDKLTEYHTGMSCRVGIPVEHLAHGYRQEICSPIFATGLGLLFRGISDVERGIIDYSDYIEAPKPEVEVPVVENEGSLDEKVEEKELVTEGSNKTWYDKLFRKTKEFFETGEDKEF